MPKKIVPRRWPKPSSRADILTLIERYHPLPAEMAELAALVRSAPDEMEAAWAVVRVLWAEYQNLWFALERDWTKRSGVLSALSTAFMYADPWAAFKAQLSRPEGQGPTLARRLQPPVRVFRNTTPGSAEPFFEEVHVPKLDDVPGSPVDADYLVVVPVGGEYDPAGGRAGLRVASSAVVKKLSGDRPDWELLLQLYAERQRYPSLSDTAFCADMVGGYKRIERWHQPPADQRTVEKDLKHAVKLFGRLTPDKPLAALVAEMSTA